MLLNDAEKITLCKRITLPEFEVLYWLLEDALNENSEKAKTYFDILCYIAAYRRKEISQTLKPVQLKRLQAISYQIHGKEIPAAENNVQLLPAYEPIDIPIAKESEINHYLYKNAHIIKNALKKNGRLIAREYIIEGYRCDLVFENSTTLYPIELKKTQADHKVVSQVDKYCHYFYLKMRYNHFKNIQGVCIANGYDTWAVNELRRKGHLIFRLTYNDNKLGISQII